MVLTPLEWALIGVLATIFTSGILSVYCFFKDPEQKKLGLELRQQALEEKRAAKDKDRLTKHLTQVIEQRRTVQPSASFVMNETCTSLDSQEKNRQSELTQLIAANENSIGKKSYSYMATTASKLVDTRQSNQRGTIVELTKSQQK